MNQTLAQQTLQYVAVTSALCKRALDTLAIKQAAEKRASAQVPALVDLLIQNSLIGANEKQAALEALNDHTQALAILKSAVDKLAAAKKAGIRKEASDLGHAEGSAVPEAQPAQSNYLGRRTSEKKGSDIALLKAMGMATE